MLYLKQKEYIDDRYGYNPNRKYVIFSILQAISLFLIVTSFLGGLWTKLELELPEDTIIRFENGTKVFKIQHIKEWIPNTCIVETNFERLIPMIACFCIVISIGFSLFSKKNEMKKLKRWGKYIVLFIYMIAIFIIAFFHQDEISTGFFYIIEKFLSYYNSYFSTDVHIMDLQGAEMMWASEAILFLAAILMLLCGFEIFFFQSIKLSLSLMVLYVASIFIIGFVPDTTYTCLMAFGMGMVWLLGKRQELLCVWKEKGKVAFQQNYNEKMGIQRVFYAMIAIMLVFWIVIESMLTPCFIWFENRREISSIISEIGNLDPENIVSKVEELVDSLGDKKPNESGMGMAGGEIGKAESVKGNGATDLIITLDGDYVGYIYLKGYVGSVYTKNSWNQLPSSTSLPLEELIQIEQKLVEVLADEESHIEVKRVRANAKYEYIPYLAQIDSQQQSYYRNGWLAGDGEAVKNYNTNPVMEPSDILFKLSFYPYVNQSFLIQDLNTSSLKSILKHCLEYPEEKLEAVKQDFLNYIGPDVGIEPHSTEDNNISTSFYAITSYIKSYLAQKATYSLSPGATPENRDFVEYFLTEQKEGYCVHFATTAAILYRMCGYPTRYVEGYLTYVRGAGTYEVKNNTAHAWVEVFLDELGWVPVEVTPGYTQGQIPDNTGDEEETKDFVEETQAPDDSSQNQEESEETQQNNSNIGNWGMPDGSIGGNSQNTIPLSQFWRNVVNYIIIPTIKLLLAIILIWGVIVIRSHILLTDRIRRISNGNNRQIVLSLYQFTCRLAKKYHVSLDCEGDLETMHVQLAMIGLEKSARLDTLKRWEEIVQKAYFYPEPLSNEERLFVSDIYRELYFLIKSKRMGRFLLKYIYCYP